MSTLHTKYDSKRLFVSGLGSRPVAAMTRAATAHNLRVVAYHGVADRERFEAQIEWIASAFEPVSGQAVADAVVHGRSLPRRSVWLTFDDGYADVVELALPVLRTRGIPATLFVSPGLVVSREAPWWDVIDLALRSGWRADLCSAFECSVANLKRVSDATRRRVVDSARQHLAASADLPITPIATEEQLRGWLESDMEIGNHTWDHPCLDKCDADEQMRQISSAHSWLSEFGGERTTRLFAYPNGHWTPDAARALADRGYALGLLFDHRLNDRRINDPFRVSRLRLDSDADLSRARAIVSGPHSFIYRSRNTNRA
jgi:peptidoglycan/xylan/chitin deacetylase (PgdA/CDA1 family)